MVIPGGTYAVTLQYQDMAGNPVASVTRNGVFLKTPNADLVLPVSNTASRAPVTVRFALPAPAKRGTLRLDFVQGTEPQRTLTLSDTLRNVGGTFQFDPAAPASTSDAVVAGSRIPDGVYSVQLRYQNAAGTPMTTPVVTGFTIDTVTQAPILTESSFADGNATVIFSLPEPAQAGSVTLNFASKSNQGFKSVLVLDDSNETAGLHSVEFPLSSPSVEGSGVVSGDPVPNGRYDILLSYSDVLGNPRAVALAPSVDVNGGQSVPQLRIDYARKLTGKPLNFSFSIPESPQTQNVFLVFEKGGDTFTFVLKPDFEMVGDFGVGFDPLNPMASGFFVSAPTLASGSYNVTLKYLNMSNVVASSSTLVGVRVGQDADLVLGGAGVTSSRMNGGAPVSTFSGALAGFSPLRFGVPSAMGAGAMAYQVTCVDGSGKRKRAIFADGSTEPVAFQGGQAPGAGFPYLLLGTPVANKAGDLAFSALLGSEDPEGGLWVRRNGVLSIVYRESQPVTTFDGNVVLLGGVTDIALAENGDLIFTALRTEDSVDSELLDAEDVPQIFSLWRQNSAGQLSELLSTGDELNFSEGDVVTVKVVKAIAAFGSFAGTPDQRRGFNSLADLVVRVGFTDGSSGLMKFPSSGSSSILMRTGDTLSSEDAVVESFGLPSVGDDGSALLRAGLVKNTDSAVTKENDAVILRVSGEGSLVVAVRKGVTLVGSEVVASVGDPVGDGVAEFAFLGSVKEAEGAGAAVPAIIRVSDASELSVLARKGGAAPGAGGARFNVLRSLAWNGASGGYGPAFVATLKTGESGVTSANDVGLWVEDSSGNIQLVLREGDSIGIGDMKKQVRLFTVLSAVSGSSSQGHSTIGDGTFAVRVTFADYTEAVLNVVVP